MILKRYPQNTDSACPPGYYWNGKACVKVPKNAFVTSDKDEYERRQAAYADSLDLSNMTLREQLGMGKNDSFRTAGIYGSPVHVGKAKTPSRNESLQNSEKGDRSGINIAPTTAIPITQYGGNLVQGRYIINPLTGNYTKPFTSTIEDFTNFKELKTIYKDLTYDEYQRIKRKYINDPHQYLISPGGYSEKGNTIRPEVMVNYLHEDKEQDFIYIYPKPKQPIIYSPLKEELKAKKSITTNLIKPNPTDPTTLVQAFLDANVKNFQQGLPLNKPDDNMRALMQQVKLTPTEALTVGNRTLNTYRVEPLNAVQTTAPIKEVEIKPEPILPLPVPTTANTTPHSTLQNTAQSVPPIPEELGPDSQESEYTTKYMRKLGAQKHFLFYSPRFRKPGHSGPLVKKGKKVYLTLPTLEKRLQATRTFESEEE